MKVIKLIFNIILRALFIFLMLLIFLLAIYFVSIKISQKKGTLNKIPINIFVIITQSMQPTINPGDIVIDYTPKDKKYEVGDVVTYLAIDGYHAGSTVTHRVIEVVENDGARLYRTKGDYNNTADFSLVKEEDIIGKTVFRIPKAGYVRQFLVTKVGWVVAVIFPCLVIIGYDLLQAMKKRLKVTVNVNSVKVENNIIGNSKVNFTEDNKVERDSGDNEEDFWGID